MYKKCVLMLVIISCMVIASQSMAAVGGSWLISERYGAQPAVRFVMHVLGSSPNSAIFITANGDLGTIEWNSFCVKMVIGDTVYKGYLFDSFMFGHVRNEKKNSELGIWWAVRL